jgi:hypothetical protein
MSMKVSSPKTARRGTRLAMSLIVLVACTQFMPLVEDVDLRDLAPENRDLGETIPACDGR